MKKNSGILITMINVTSYFVPNKIWNVNKVLSLLICIFFGNILSAQNEEPGLPDSPPTVSIDGLLYKLYEDSHTAIIANANTWEGELVIPEQITYENQKYIVNKIEWLAFVSCTTLTKVRIPKTVTDIQHYASYEACKNPFVGCTSLEAIEVDEENPSMCSVDGILFSRDKSRLYCYPAGARTTTYIVPDDVTWIGGTAFAHNNYLRSVAIPNSVTFLGFEAFGSCRNLKSVRLSENREYHAQNVRVGKHVTEQRPQGNVNITNSRVFIKANNVLLDKGTYINVGSTFKIKTTN